MEERIIGMLEFLNNEISVLEKMEQTESVRELLQKWSGTASACYRLVLDDRFLDVIERVNKALSLAHSSGQRLERCARRQSQGMSKRLFQMPRFAAFA